MENGQQVPGSLWIYAPNKAAPIFFTALFAASCMVHFWQCLHYKCFKLTVMFPISCLIFTAAYIARAYGAFHYTDVAAYVVSVMLVYLAPPILELQNYHTLGRLLYFVPYNAPIHPGRVLTTFGMLSTVVEILNGLGVGYTANPASPTSYVQLGRGLLKASLLVQVVVITLFCILAGVFHYRCARTGITADRKIWPGPLLALYISMMLILARTIYRTAEYFSVASEQSSSYFSSILRYEWYFYVFDASPMLANAILWNFRHPRRYLPERSEIYLHQYSFSEVEGPGWEDKRPWLLTALDPFAIFTGSSRRQKPFWETAVGGNSAVDV